MKRSVISLFFFAIFASFSDHTKADKSTKVLCNEEFMMDIHILVNKIPLHVAEEIQKCIQELEPDLALEDVTVKCHTGIGVRKVPALYYNIVQHPLEFAECGSSVTETMEDVLSASEKENLANVEEEGMRLFERVSSMY